MPHHRVDVLIPAYNVAATVEAAVRSILGQTVRDLRVVVVDDGSTDGTAAIVARLGREDDRITLLRQPNGGIVDALNNGLALCEAPFVARHDGDDLAYPDRLEKQLAYLDAHPDCVAVGANARHVDAAGAPTGTVSTLKAAVASDPDWFPAIEPYLMHPLLLVRRIPLSAVGGYRHAFHAEDTDLYWRLKDLGRLHNLSDVLADYRIHTGSVTGTSVINGRIGAVNAQLAALSSERRRRGRPDLAFPKERLARLLEAGTLEKMVALAEPGLDEEERTRLRLASAAKLLELALYRPYALEKSDWRYIRRSLRAYSSMLSAGNARDLRVHHVWYALLMIKRGRRRAVLFELPATLLPMLGLHMLRSAGRKVKCSLAAQWSGRARFNFLKVRNG